MVSANVPREPLQPKIPPLRLENRNRSLLNPEPLAVLKTMPVGVPPLPPAPGPGIVTTRPNLLITGGDWAPPEYSVATPVPAFAIQAGLVGVKAIPHGSTRFGSMICAPATLLTKSV